MSANFVLTSKKINEQPCFRRGKHVIGFMMRFFWILSYVLAVLIVGSGIVQCFAYHEKRKLLALWFCHHTLIISAIICTFAEKLLGVRHAHHVDLLRS